MYLHILLIVITVFHPVDSNTFCPVTITVGGKPSIRVLHKVVLVSPISFNIFLNDVEITYDGFPALFKYADDSTIVAPVLGNTDIITSVALVNEFLNWSQDNCMP